MNRHRWQSWLTVIGVMLGVAMVVGVDLANNSARRAFSLSLQSIAGPTTHQIIGGPTGIPEQLFTKLRTELAIRSSLPMVTGPVIIRGESFSLLGVDPVSEASVGRHTAGLQYQGLGTAISSRDSMMLPERAATRLHLKPLDIFNLQIGDKNIPVRLAATFPSENPAATDGLIFADIAVAQRLLNRFGYLDRIDLILDDKTSASVRTWLPPGLSLVDSESRNDNLRQMSEAFHINLTAMSLLALLVATLLIYNTVTLSVLQRRNTLGIYRALGVTRKEVFFVVIRESLALATIASLAGLLLGLLLGQVLVELVTRTVNDLFFNLHVTAFIIDPFSLLKGFVVGLGMSLAACSLPAWEASRNQPISVMQRSVLERRWQRRLPKFTIGAIIMLAIGFVMLVPTHGTLVEGFVALTFIVLGFCLLVPVFLILATRSLLRLFSPWLNSTARIAIRDISAGISRTGMAVAALTVAVSVTVGVGVMVSSFRETVNLWLGQYLSADIYISTADRSGTGLTQSLIVQLQAIPGVSSVSPSRVTTIETQFGPIRTIATTPIKGTSSLPLKHSVNNALTLFDQGKGVMITEPLAYHQQLAPGDSINVVTNEGTKALSILGVYYDFTSSTGMIALHRNAYRQWWNDERISTLSIYRDADANQMEVLKAIKMVLKDEDKQIRVSSNREIREVAIAVFDRTFEITRVLRILAIVVAFVGVLSALMALQLERTREFAILRATGMTPKQIGLMIFGQTSLMGVLAGIMSIPLGLVMANILIDVINRRSFGWSMLYHMPTTVLVEALLLAIFAAALAGIYPALKASSISPAQALREE
ncbi:MAG: FtsX-like permease family protein [Oceanicoccus sp.]